MASLSEFARAHTSLDPAATAHLQRLVASWALPCDVSFSDLLLYAPCDLPATEFVVLGHARSATGATVYLGDPVGEVVSVQDRPLLAAAFQNGTRREGIAKVEHHAGLILDDTVDEQLRIADPGQEPAVENVPVRVDGRVVAVLTRETAPGLLRHRGALETVYRGVWERIATMVEEGTFPLALQERVGEFREPRVGDGVALLDREQRVEFASPNAMSALHRIGVRSNIEGRALADVGIETTVIAQAFATHHSTITELEADPDLTVVVRCLPLIEQGRTTGALVVFRDVSELRSRDRLLLSKDTTIREIHHRVKNNLQTIQSLLRLQSRRLESAEARAAVAQSARRIGSIAIVHETLSTNATDVVDFDEVVDRVVRMVEDGFSSPERPLVVDVSGELGELPGEIAMPLSVALTELLQNAIDHAASHRAEVRVELDGSRRELVVRIENGGPGVPDAFSLDRDAGLGLTIVRTFIVHDLGGTISFGPAHDDAPRGTRVEIRVPRRPLGRSTR